MPSIKKRVTPRQIKKRRRAVIALDSENFKALTDIAKAEARSISGQATLFVEQKIKEFTQREVA